MICGFPVSRPLTINWSSMISDPKGATALEQNYYRCELRHYDVCIAEGDCKTRIEDWALMPLQESHTIIHMTFAAEVVVSLLDQACARNKIYPYGVSKSEPPGNPNVRSEHILQKLWSTCPYCKSDKSSQPLISILSSKHVIN